MAYTRRSTSDDATWARAWTADAVSDLATIAAIVGDARPHHGDIAFVTANSLYYLWMDDGTWRPLPMVNYGQLPFPATQNPSSGANVLDDYEEGDWAPTLTFGGGSTGLTYAVQAGAYTKIGRQVVITGLLFLSAKGSSTGAAVIGGVPFTVPNGNKFYSASGGYLANMSATPNNIILESLINTATLIPFYSAAGSVTQYTDAEFTDTSIIIMHATFFTS